MRSKDTLTAPLRAVIGELPGVVASGVASHRWANGMQYVDLVVQGWSPSLHAHRMRWGTKASDGGSPDEQLAAALVGLSAEMDNQRARIARATKLGIEKPLPASDSAPIYHMRIDEGLAALMLERDPDFERFMRSIRRSVSTLNAMSSSGWHDSLVGDDSIDGDRWSRRIELAPGIGYDGRQLEIQDVALPDSIVSAAAGRLLREVAEVPAAVADHVVVAASTFVNETMPPRTAIIVKPRYTTVMALMDAHALRGPAS